MVGNICANLRTNEWKAYLLSVFNNMYRKGILMNNKLMILMVGCLSFGAVQAMNFPDPAYDYLESRLYKLIEDCWISADLGQLDSFEQGLEKFLRECGPNKLDLNWPFISVREYEGPEDLLLKHRPTVSVSVHSAVARLIEMEIDRGNGASNFLQVNFLVMVKKNLDDYQSEVLPEGRYAWDHRPKGLVSKKALLFGAATGVVVVVWGIWKLFFAEEKKGTV